MPKYGEKIETVRLMVTVPKEMEADILKDIYSTIYRRHPYYKKILAYMRKNKECTLKTLAYGIREDLGFQPDITKLKHIAEIFELKFKQ